MIATSLQIDAFFKQMNSVMIWCMIDFNPGFYCLTTPLSEDAMLMYCMGGEL